MSDGDALLAAVLRDPFDDTPRLVYADWLDEQPVERITCPNCEGKGTVPARTTLSRRRRNKCRVCNKIGTVIDNYNKDRAEFIRKDIRLSKLNNQGWIDSCLTGEFGKENALANYGQAIHDLSFRCRTILEEHEFRMVSPLGDIGFQANSTWVPECEWEFSRGFVHAVTTSQLHLMNHLVGIFGKHPVTTVFLPDRTPYAENFSDQDVQYVCRWFSPPGVPSHPNFSDEDDNHILHQWLVDEMICLRRLDQCGKFPWHFMTVDGARGALSQACVNVGRRVNRLPLLYGPRKGELT